MTLGDLTGITLADRYQVVQQLGKGGSASVFLARDLRYDRDVAIKVLKPELAAAIGVDRFHREIATLAALQHPNILPVYDSGEVDGRPFFVTPYVSGKTLRDRLREEGCLTIDDVIHIVAELAEALDYAHDHGIVHRDIKPENILLHKQHAVLADFGIARAIDVATGDRLTDSYFVIGTPAYMSPEQSEPGELLDARTDVYSLAVVAYEALAGCVPFEGPTPRAIQARKLLKPARHLRQLRHGVPHDVDSAIMRGLATEPTERYPSAGAFATALADARPTVRLPVPPRILAAIALGIALVAVAAMQWMGREPAAAARAASRVVVAEFENLTGNASFDNLGITAVDWLTEGLQRTGVVTAIPTETAIRASRFARGTENSPNDDPILTLAQETNADVVVSGRIYQSQDSLQYQIQVLDADARRVIGAIGPVATPASDPLAGLSTVRARLMSLLAAGVDDRIAEFVNRLPQPPIYDAYRHFSLGLDRYTESDFEAAVPHFFAAHARDSAFAAPLLFASISLSNQGRYRVADSLLNELAASRARLSPFHQAWLDYRRNLLAGQRRAALTAVRALDSAAPGSKATYNHGLEALENGYVEEAIATLRSLSPDVGAMRGWIPYYEVLGAAYHMAGRFSDELVLGQEARRRYPHRLYAFLPSVRATAALGRREELDRLLPQAAQLPADAYGTTFAELLLSAGQEVRAHGSDSAARTYLTRALAQLPRASGGAPTSALQLRGQIEATLGMWDAAARTAQALLAEQPNDPAHFGGLGVALAHLDRAPEAREIMRQLAEDRRPYLFGGPSLAQARIAAALGDRDAAVDHLARAFAEGREYDLWVHRDPDFASLRSLPRFRSLVALRR